MPDWSALVPDVTLLQGVLWIVAISLFIGVVVKLWPFIRNAVAIVDALVQLPGLAAQVAAMKTQVDSIHHETHNNDGSSIKDSQDRTEAAVQRIEASVEGVHGRLDTVEMQVTALTRADEEIRAELESTQPPREKP